MKIEQLRHDRNSIRTRGVVLVDGRFFCYSLEDPIRDVKVYGKTAIPAGVYDLSIRYSPKFKREMIWVLDVPNFEYIMIHGGNTVADTLGCPLYAKNLVGDNAIQGTMEKPIFALVKNALARGEKCTLTIKDC